MRGKRRITKIVEYLDANYGKKIGLKELATLAGIHSSHLYRQFKELVGSSPREYVLNVRMQHAACLLRESDKSIKEIAFAVGFCRPEMFSKAFKRALGRSPRQYRDLAKSQPEDEAPRPINQSPT